MSLSRLLLPPERKCTLLMNFRARSTSTSRIDQSKCTCPQFADSCFCGLRGFMVTRPLFSLSSLPKTNHRTTMTVVNAMAFDEKVFPRCHRFTPSCRSHKKVDRAKLKGRTGQELAFNHKAQMQYMMAYCLPLPLTWAGRPEAM